MASGYSSLTKDALQTNDGINLLNNMLEVLFDNMPGDTNTVRIYSGYGVPAIAAGVGSLYQRLDGGANTTLYVREATGWVAK
jgi:hypothetical protein